jgi:hypothetical protein
MEVEILLDFKRIRARGKNLEETRGQLNFIGYQIPPSSP